MMEFKSIGDILSFVKSALFMSETSAAKKIRKWKSNGELVFNDLGESKLTLKTEQLNDVLFINSINTKYSNWIASNGLYTIEK